MCASFSSLSSYLVVHNCSHREHLQTNLTHKHCISISLYNFFNTPEKQTVMTFALSTIILILIFLVAPFLFYLYPVFSRILPSSLKQYLQSTSTFRKLPQLPIFGRLGWLLGNVDIYLYAMRHLSVAEGNLEINFFFNFIIFIISQEHTK